MPQRRRGHDDCDRRRRAQLRKPPDVFGVLYRHPRPGRPVVRSWRHGGSAGPVSDANVVQLGPRLFRVTLSAESVGRSYYRVTFDGSPPRSWKAAEVSVNAASAITCMTCKRPPADPCIRVAIVQKWLAAQPLAPVPGQGLAPANRHEIKLRMFVGRV